MFKKLNATPWMANELTKTIPVTALERFILLIVLDATAPQTFEALKRWRDLFEQLIAAEPALQWDEASASGIKTESFEDVIQVPFTRLAAQTAADVAKTHAPNQPGRRAMALLDLHERIKFVLESEE